MTIPIITTYKGMTIVSNPAYDAGLAWTNNFKTLTNRIPQSNLSASANPAATDDVSKGYYQGSVWVRSDNNYSWICTRNTAGYAVWNAINPSVLTPATMAGDGLTYGGGVIDVDVDGTYIETNADALRVVAGSVNRAKLDPSMQTGVAGTFIQGSESSGSLTAPSLGGFVQGYAQAANIQTNSTGSKGSFAQGYASGSFIRSKGPGCFAQGYTNGSGAIDAGLSSVSGGALAQGYITASITQLISASTGAIAQGYANEYSITAYKGSIAQGAAKGSHIAASGLGAIAQGYAAGGSIYATANGSMAQGYTYDSGYLKSTGIGSFCQGYSAGNMKATGSGSFAQGFCNASEYLQATGDGSFTHGYASGGNLRAGGDGSFAAGYVASARYIGAYGIGSFAHGFVNVVGTPISTSWILASSAGTFAQGYALGNKARIETYQPGSFAHGHAGKPGQQGSNLISALAKGSFAVGYAWSVTGKTGYIKATGIGSLAHGYVAGNIASGSIIAQGNGSWAFGSAANSNIIAEGVNSVQIGVGTNDVDGSLQLASGIRICGDTDPGASVSYGDIYLKSNYVYIKSDGNTYHVETE